MRAVSFTPAWRRYARSEEGAVSPLIGVAAVALVGTMGLAVDAGRAGLVHAKLITSTDASGLAVGARLSTVDMTAEAEKFVRGNFPPGYAGATLTSVNATANDDGSVITVRATANMPTTLLKVVGVNSVNLNVTSEITRAVSGLELVLALDNTGSMAGSKLASLKTASHDLLDIVFGTGDAPDDLYVGVVPFSQAVNIGRQRSAWVDPSYTELDWGKNEDDTNHRWAGCVEARVDGADRTDDPPSSELFDAYYWKDTESGKENDWRYVDTRDVCVKRKPNGKCQTWEEEEFYVYTITENETPNKSCPARVTPMTSSQQTVENAIDNMKATGSTYINLGAVWAWRMLSPRWRDLWGGSMDANDLPLDYNTPRMNKAMVIMTDGNNDISPSSTAYAAYGSLADGRLGTTNEATAEAQLNARLTTVCNNAKGNTTRNANDDRIKVYTVILGAVTSTTEALMRGCASQDDFYFNSPTAADLQIAFKTIGDSLANLRVSK